ncbi:hypothetical protein BC834DRAFT_97224 [Gloeopeniophorella convolvens]|nr:hypothetical protein BC834DRAFT_97224 [Gloeopeniophorella convolvens]
MSPRFPRFSSLTMSSAQGEPFPFSPNAELYDPYDQGELPHSRNITLLDLSLHDRYTLQPPSSVLSYGVQGQYARRSQAMPPLPPPQQPHGFWNHPQAQQPTVASLVGGYEISDQFGGGLSSATATYYQEPATVDPAHLSLPVSTPNGTDHSTAPLTRKAQGPAYLGHHPGPVFNPGHHMSGRAVQDRRTPRKADGHASNRSAQKPTSTKRPRAAAINQGSSHRERFKYPCPLCSQPCSRPQELRRHIREKHLPQSLLCREPGCDWSGHRDGLLLAHLTKTCHNPLHSWKTYDGDQLAKLFVEGKMTIETALHNAKMCRSQPWLWTRLYPDDPGAQVGGSSLQPETVNLF